MNKKEWDVKVVALFVNFIEIRMVFHLATALPCIHCTTSRWYVLWQNILSYNTYTPDKRWTCERARDKRAPRYNRYGILIFKIGIDTLEYMYIQSKEYISDRNGSNICYIQCMQHTIDHSLPVALLLECVPFDAEPFWVQKYVIICTDEQTKLYINQSINAVMFG